MTTLASEFARRRRDGQGPLGHAEAVALLAPVVRQLAALHATGAAHLAISPAAIRVKRPGDGATPGVFPDGNTISLDLLAPDESPSVDAAYLAPEQVAPRRFGRPGPAADVFALALVLVEMLTGSAVHRATTPSGWLAATTARRARTPRARGAAVPEDLELLCARLLRVDPRERLRTAVVLERELAALDASAPAATTPTADELLDHPGAFPPTVALPARAARPSAPSTRRASRWARVVERWVVRARATRLGRRELLLSMAALTALVGVVRAVTPVVRRLVWPPRRPALHTAPPAPPDGPPRDGSRYFRAFDARAFERGGERALPIEAARGTHHVEAVFAAGRLVEVIARRPSGAIERATRVVDDEGARRLDERDDLGQVRSRTRVTPDGLVTVEHASGERRIRGCAELKLGYDDAGRIDFERCLDASGSSVTDLEGCVERRFERDASGNKLTDRCLDGSGAAAEFATGESVRLDEHDDAGFVVAHRRTTLRGEPFVFEGCASLIFDRDPRGNVLRETCLDAEGQPTRRHPGQPPTLERTYDENGCWVTSRHLDERGRQASTHARLRSVERSVDAGCRARVVARRAETGAQRWPDDEPPFQAFVLDAAGRVVERRCAQADRPASCTGSPHVGEGSIVRIAHDDHGRRREITYHDAQGRPSTSGGARPHRERFVYDLDGQMVGSTYHDQLGAPAPAYDVVLSTEFEHDASGRLLRVRHFGADHAPVVPAHGCHALVIARDEAGREQSRACIGTRGEGLQTSGLSWQGVRWPQGTRRIEIIRHPELRNVCIDAVEQPSVELECAATPCYP